MGKIDFKTLKRLLNAGHKRTLVRRLEDVIEKRIQRMIRLNKSRIDFLQKFQRMIDAYNVGGKNMERFFQELNTFVQGLDEEEKRGMREGLGEEELALFDILTKPEVKLTRKERVTVKEVAEQLLHRLKEEKLALDWRKRQQSQAEVRLIIETMLDQLPRTYTRDLYMVKCELVYQHIFNSLCHSQRLRDGGMTLTEGSATPVRVHRVHPFNHYNEPEAVLSKFAREVRCVSSASFSNFCFAAPESIE